MTELTDDVRIARMLGEGKLTAEEAMRLKDSLAAHTAREASPRAAATTAKRKPLWPLLCLLTAFFVLGAGFQWLPGERAGGADIRATTIESSPSTVPKGRLIDFSGLSEERRTTMNRSVPLFIGAVTVGVIAVLGALLMFLYNGLVSSREQVNAGWAQVENVYQRRLDLVPLLVDAVQAYTEHERETLSELTRARSEAIQVSGAMGPTPPTEEQLEVIEAAQDKVESALARLFAVVEAYPELKASRNFLSLQDQVEGTENRVTMERRSYNEFSRRYNTRLQTFPGNIVAVMMGFEPKPYFEAEAKALKGPEDPFGRRDG